MKRITALLLVLGLLLAACAVALCGALIGVVAYVLGMLVLEATAMREENDLTI